VGIEFVPAVVAPAGFEAHQGFIPRRGPELAGAFEAALVLPTGGLDGPRTQWFIGPVALRGRGRAGLDGGAGGDDFLVIQAVSVVVEVSDLGLEFLLLGGLQARLEFFRLAMRVGV
jgi:hypothetical protein